MSFKRPPGYPRGRFHVGHVDFCPGNAFFRRKLNSTRVRRPRVQDKARNLRAPPTKKMRSGQGLESLLKQSGALNNSFRERLGPRSAPFRADVETHHGCNPPTTQTPWPSNQPAPLSPLLPAPTAGSRSVMGGNPPARAATSIGGGDSPSPYTGLGVCPFGAGGLTANTLQHKE